MPRRPPRRASLLLLVLTAACGARPRDVGSAALRPSASAPGAASAAPIANPGVQPGDVAFQAKDGTTWVARRAPDLRATEASDAKAGASRVEQLAPDGSTLASFEVDSLNAPLGSRFSAVFEEADRIYVAIQLRSGIRLLELLGGKLVKVEGGFVGTAAFVDTSGTLWSAKPRTVTIVRSKVDATELSATALPPRTSADAVYQIAPRPSGGACVVTTTGDLAGLDASGALAFVAPLRERATSVTGIEDACFAVTETGVVRADATGAVARLALPGLIDARVAAGAEGEVRVVDSHYTATVTLDAVPKVLRVERSDRGLHRGPAVAQVPYALVPEVPGATLRARTLKTLPAWKGPLAAAADARSALYADGYESLVAIDADGKERVTKLGGDPPARWTKGAMGVASTVIQVGGLGWLAFDFETPVPTGTASHVSIFRLDDTRRVEVAGDVSYYDVLLAPLGSSVAVASYGHAVVGFVKPNGIESLPVPAGALAMRGFGDELVFATEDGVFRAKLGEQLETLARGYWFVGMDAIARGTIWASATSALVALEDGHARAMTAPIQGTVAVRDTDDVWVGSGEGIAHFDGKRWTRVPNVADVASIVVSGRRVFYATKPADAGGHATIGVVDEDVRDAISTATETRTVSLDAPRSPLSPGDATGITLTAAKIDVAGGPALASACLARPLHGATGGAWVVDGQRALSLEGSTAKSVGPADCGGGLVPAAMAERVPDPWGVDVSPTGVAWFAMPGAAPIAARATDGVVTWFAGAPRSTIIDVDATRDDVVWFAGGIGRGELTRWDGTSFTTTFTSHKLHAVSSIGDDVWAVGDFGTVVHVHGDEAPAVVRVGPSHLRAVLASSATDVWAAGADATLLHFDGATWTQVPTPSVDANAQLQALFAWQGKVYVGGHAALYRVER